MSSSDMKKDLNDTQISHWLSSVHQIIPYREPVLDESTVNIIKLTCKDLDQGTEEFIATIEILEEYIRIKNEKKVKIDNSMLAVCCGLMISSKLIGSVDVIKISDISKIMLKLTQENVSKEKINAVEMDMVVTMKNSPSPTIATDVLMLLWHYLPNETIRRKLEKICMLLTSLFCVIKKELFFKIKDLYNASGVMRENFRRLVCSKLYFPATIVLYAIKVGSLRRFFNVDQVQKDLAEIANISPRDIHVLSEVMHKLIWDIYSNK